MLPQDQFDRLKQELSAFDELREDLIKRSRRLNTLAKQGLYKSHRDEFSAAEETFKEADPLAAELIKAYEENPKAKIGAVTAALQEWGECKAYHIYASEGRLATQEELGLEAEDYLLALADLSGELLRRAVLASIAKDHEKAKAIRDSVDELHGVFVQFDFRNGELRKKADRLRWNLQKIEELLVK